MLDTLSDLRQKVVIGFVGGSDLNKQLEQLGPKGNVLSYKSISMLFMHVSTSP